MSNVLFLVHRLPYPPDKGDKVRSHHMLRYLGEHHRVFVGAFIDDPADAEHRAAVAAMCAELHLESLDRRWGKLGSLRGLLRGEPLTLTFYRHAGMQAWVDELLERERVDVIVVFSAAMALYAQSRGIPLLLDLVDLDSAKWTDYAPRHAWPMSWLYRREGRKLLAFEQRMVGLAACAFFVTRAEAELYRRRSADVGSAVEVVGNGVDTDYFAPDMARASPFRAGETAIVFTGAMDYAPNIDAVTWFARDMLPALRRDWPALRLNIVGRNPTREVRALAGPAVHVTGTVADVRPYLQHAAVVVAPLRMVRGLQNKVLEALAMQRPLVVTGLCAAALEVDHQRDLVVADDAPGFVRAIGQLLGDPEQARRIGQSGGRRMREEFRWTERLAPLGRHVARQGQRETA